MTTALELLVRKRNRLSLSLHEALDTGSDVDRLHVASAMEDVINLIPGNDETVYGLGCRAMVAEARRNHLAGARYRKAQVDRMLAARAANRTSGLDSVYRQMLAEVDESELDDNFDEYDDDEIISEWRMAILDLWGGLCYEESLRELLMLKKFGEQIGVGIEDLDDWASLITAHEEMP